MLPEDITIEILSRLPVKSLIRFRCVCKSWNTLVDNPMFIWKHHQTVSSKQGSEVLLISRRDNFTNRRVISLLRNVDAVTNQDHLPNFLNDMFGHIRLIGPCNGVVCLYGFADNIALWNPSIRDFTTLPASAVPRPHNAKVRGGDLGLGFDPKTRDLKVIQILFCISSDLGLIYQVEIYSSRAKKWRMFERNVPANIMYHNLWSMVFKNDIFCWWAQDHDSDKEVILSFDMSEETFQKTPLPPDVEVLGLGQHGITRAILPLKESIALLVYRRQELEKVFDVWTLSDLGGKCWSKMRSIGPVSCVEKPLGFWKDEEEFILQSSDGELVMYNRADGRIKNLGLHGKRNRLEVLVYKESLFSVS